MKKMRRRVKIYTAAIFLSSLVSACGAALEDRSFPLSMGVDYVNNRFEVYYGMPDLSGVTGQKKDDEKKGAGEEADFYQGKDMEEAEDMFLASQENYLDMGHLKVILLGDGILNHEDAYKSLLHYLENKSSVAGNIYVFACSSLPQVMEMDGTEMDSLGDYLTGIIESRPHSKADSQVDLQELYNAWHNGEVRPEFLEVKVSGNKVLLDEKSHTEKE